MDPLRSCRDVLFFLCIINLVRHCRDYEITVIQDHDVVAEMTLE